MMRSRPDWPQDITPRQTGPNFRPSVSARFERPARNWRNERPGMSAAHLVLVRQMPCAVCPNRLPVYRIEAHHLKAGAARRERALFMKATDRWAVPLCIHHHNDLERLGSRNEHEWFASYGIDEPFELASALWFATGDLARMGLILTAHKQAAIKTLSAQRRNSVRGGEARAFVGHSTKA